MSAWFAARRPKPEARLRIFGFPYAGGAASVFREWHDLLPATVELLPVELPGRGARWNEPPFTRLGQLVEALADAIVPYLDRPFHFFGHSLGAFVSFELARQLRRGGQPQPARLCVSAARAPHIAVVDRRLRDLPEPRLKRTLLELNGTPRAVLEHDELMRMVLPVLRADFAVYETYGYVSEPPFDFPIAVCGGMDDDQVSPNALAAWREHTRAAFSLRIVPGDHFFLHEQQSRAVLVRELTGANGG